MWKERVIPVLWLWLAFIIIGAEIGTAISKSDLTSYSQAVCYTWDQLGVNETSIKIVGDILINNKGLSPETAGDIVLSATATYCPQYLVALQKTSQLMLATGNTALN